MGPPVGNWRLAFLTTYFDRNLLKARTFDEPPSKNVLAASGSITAKEADTLRGGHVRESCHSLASLSRYQTKPLRD
jgi:hypothetical protein